MEESKNLKNSLKQGLACLISIFLSYNLIGYLFFASGSEGGPINLSIPMIIIALFSFVVFGFFGFRLVRSAVGTPTKSVRLASLLSAVALYALWNVFFFGCVPAAAIKTLYFFIAAKLTDIGIGLNEMLASG